MKKNSNYPYQFHNPKSFEPKQADDEDVHRINFKEDHRAVRSSSKAPVKKLESKPSMDINESAENFINNFRKQLMIQRLESIENYENMLARGL
ncbi:hypothetical protein M5689_021489 [Euphorbia peplus]|nr:hypothetical protein M5689_021489 [Euphorbia peplus]